MIELRVFATWWLLLLVWGCSRQPRPTIKYDRMVDLVADLYMAEEISRDYPVILRDSMNLELTQSLLKIYNVTQEELDTNLYLYGSDYEMYQRLLKDVKSRMDLLSENPTNHSSPEILESEKK